MTQREKLISALARRGYRQVASRTTKYVVMTKDHCSFYFIGKAGALQKGRTASDSYSMENLRLSLLAEKVEEDHTK